MMPVPLPREFYDRPTLTVARELLGKQLVHRLDGEILRGRIVETEAYIGRDDPACHAAAGLTPRTRLMFGPPGFAYVYFIYGMYFCLNAVTEARGFPAAVLIRAVEPLSGLATMRRLRNKERLSDIGSGPGKLCQAFDINKVQNGLDLCGSSLMITADDSDAAPAEKVISTTRIGIRVGTEKPWRFILKDNPFISNKSHQ